MRPKVFFLIIILGMFISCSVNEERLVIEDTEPVPNITFAGVRSSSYGIKPFPSPAQWGTYIKAMSGYFRHASPCAIWIVGIVSDQTGCFLNFPSEGEQLPDIVFGETDENEAYLNLFDESGITVFLQVEPANGDVPTLIDLVLKRYGHHKCVIGFGVDVEWYREHENPGWGVKVDDRTAETWERIVKTHHSDYRLFLKHWDRLWMPPNYRGDIVFVDDSQNLGSLDSMVEEFSSYWAAFFSPNTVLFQVGYESDRIWWQNLDNPPRSIGEAIGRRVAQDCGIFWVDFTLREVFSDGGR